MFLDVFGAHDWHIDLSWKDKEWKSFDASPRILLYLLILVSSIAVTDLIEQPLADRLKKFSDQIQLPGRGKVAGPFPQCLMLVDVGT